MANLAEQDEAERSRIVLGLLESVERDGGTSQRRLAAELGIALGLVNAYLRRCVKKGLVKVAHAPARRYAYYLTPQGFAEKSRLTVEYLSYSFSFFRAARADCAAALGAGECARLAARRARRRVRPCRNLDHLCARERRRASSRWSIPRPMSARFIGLPVVASFADLPEPCDAVLLTDLRDPVDDAAARARSISATSACWCPIS